MSQYNGMPNGASIQEIDGDNVDEVLVLNDPGTFFRPSNDERIGIVVGDQRDPDTRYAIFLTDFGAYGRWPQMFGFFENSNYTGQAANLQVLQDGVLRLT